MGLIMRERHAVVRELSSRFRLSSKKERSQIISQFVALSGYNRCYAAFILRTCGRKQVRMIGGKRVVFIPAHARAHGAKRHRWGPPYRTKAFLDALRQFWAVSDGLCGKRLVAFIREIVPLLERQGRLRIPRQAIREQLVAASAATIDWILAKTKRESRLKGRSLTRPGTLLKHHIPVRTFADWNDVRPGFCEADLVGHDGGSAYGVFSFTLTLTDVATTWTETEVSKNKARCNVFEAIKAGRADLPFPLLGLDSDNGGEFINEDLRQYCEDEHITFTRSRPYRKNDNCYVEQKNNSIVRHLAGYYRYDTPGAPRPCLLLLAPNSGILLQSRSLHSISFPQPYHGSLLKGCSASWLNASHINTKAPLVPSVISHYELFEKLGEGGMGVVYKAQDTKLDRVVALKFLPNHLTANETERARLLQEAKAAAALNHPNICTIYGIEEHDNELFIVMEFVDGKNLRTQISNPASPIPLDQIVDWSLQVVEALTAAHEKGVTHRDIKPDNIIVTAKNQIKVMDFGLAKLKGGLGLTRSGASVGTIAYMSPEQIQGLEVDQRTDLWALGVVLYEMLTGQRPFQGAHEPAIMYEILNVQPQAIQTVRPGSPEHLQVLVSRLLQKDPAKRISSAAEIIPLLKKSSAETPSPKGEKSIAVLYFENMSSEKEGDYFCAGMTEDIITDLSKIKVLQVVSRADVLPFRNKEVNTRQVGEMLTVNYILEGSVRKAGDKMRITAQLIDVRTGFHLWAERFDRLVEDIFDLQNEVSHKIAEALKVSLSESEKQSLAQKPTDDLRAYDFYMRGKEFLHRGGRKNNEAAIQMFENAVASDPGLASAYAGLAEAYSYMYEWYDGNASWLGKVIEMNQKALTLDPTSIEARFGIAVVYFHQKRFTEAKRILEGIVQENSQFYPACMRLGTISEISADLDSALRYYRRASELKPYEDDPWMHVDRIYRKMGLDDSAEEAAKKVIEVTSRKLEASLDDLIVMSRLAEAYARFGAKEEAYATLKAVFESDPTDGLALYNCSCAYALLGEKNKALISLRRAFESGFKAVTNRAKTDDGFDSLRVDPEFNQLIAELE